MALTVVLITLMIVPATASAAGLIAAYEEYVTGSGFEIRIVNAATGAQVTVPAGVNTPDDELHPALSNDGRHLVFTRMKLLPKLNGDIVPPAQRRLLSVDRQTGTLTELPPGVGPVFTSTSLTWGIRPQPQGPNEQVNREGQSRVGLSSSVGTLPPPASTEIRSTVPGVADIPHAAAIPVLFSEPLFAANGCQPCIVPRASRYLSLFTHDPVTGALVKSVARLSLFGETGTFADRATFGTLDFGDNGAPAGHPVPRNGDGYVAMDRTTGEDADIHSITFPGESQTTVAPAPITTTSPERMPAWSPDGLKLGFVRSSGGQRKLGVFDATPGIQTVVNPPVGIGTEAPSPQTRAFQNVYGGLSIANGPASTAPAITCDAACRAKIAGAAGLQTIPLTPKVTTTTKIGIFVARVVGKRKLLGRTAPRLRVLGKVRLGTAKKGRRNRFRWNGKVNGKRLGRGTFLLTYRSLKDRRITNTSGSIRFKVAKGGTLRRVRREPVRTPKR